MADAVIRVVLQNLSSLIQNEFGLVMGVDKDLENLSNTLMTIRDVLEDTEVKQFKDKAIKSWLKRLKDAAYDAEDILDECLAKGLQLEAHNNCSNQVSRSFLYCLDFKQLMIRHKIGQRIKDGRKRFDDIAAERVNFHLNRGVVEETVATHERQTSSIITEPQVYGRDEDKEEIVKLFLENTTNPNLLIYSIIGIGGLGKTTLAQLVYNDERVNNHFQVRIWVCVSEDFDVRRLTEATIESASGTTCDLMDLETMQSRLCEVLSGKRFLLVLDDVWNEDQEKWDKFRYSLHCGARGSSILVTTHGEKVASITASLRGHRLKGLSHDDCWSSMKQRAFGVGREENPNLAMIGKEIVKKCGGVPLAAKALGSLLHFKNTVNEWMIMRDSEIWDLPEEENSILPALRLSYNQLSSPLRHCFSYFSIFPMAYDRISKEELIRLWMANGFIPYKGRIELEDVGNEIFNELLLRSFFQDKGKDSYDNVTRYGVHDLVHDLACSISANEYLYLGGW